MEIFSEAGMERLRAKSVSLTGYMEFLLGQTLSAKFSIITPREPERRGAQISIRLPERGRKLCDRLAAEGVIGDWREPDTFRVAAVPLYNSYQDVYRFVQRFSAALSVRPSRHFSLPVAITSVTRSWLPPNIQSVTWGILRSSTPGSGRPSCAQWCAPMFCCHFCARADLLSPLSATFCRTSFLFARPSRVVVNMRTASPKARLFWALMGLGLAMWLASQVMWTYVEVYLRHEAPNPFVGDVILFLHIVPMMAAVAIQPHVQQR